MLNAMKIYGLLISLTGCVALSQGFQGSMVIERNKRDVPLWVKHDGSNQVPFEIVPDKFIYVVSTQQVRSLGSAQARAKENALAALRSFALKQMKDFEANGMQAAVPEMIIDGFLANVDKQNQISILDVYYERKMSYDHESVFDVYFRMEFSKSLYSIGYLKSTASPKLSPGASRGDQNPLTRHDKSRKNTNLIRLRDQFGG